MVGRMLHKSGLVGAVVLAMLPRVVLAQSQAGASFVAPPRSIADIAAILDQQKPDPAKIAALKQKADAPDPAGLADKDQIQFYGDRGDAALSLGRDKQAHADLRKALDLAAARQAADVRTYAERLSAVARADQQDGQPAQAADLFQQEVAVVQAKGSPGMLFTPYGGLADYSAQAGDFAAAQSWLDKLDALHRQSNGFTTGRDFTNFYAAATNFAHGKVLEVQGKLLQAEPYFRQAATQYAQAEKDTAAEKYPGPGVFSGASYASAEQLASVYWHEGKLIEGEVAARQALLGQLSMHGRYAAQSVIAVMILGSVILQEGRYADAEKLFRIALDTHGQLGLADTATVLNQTRIGLASALVAEGKPAAALDIFDQVRKAYAGDPARLTATFGVSGLYYPMAAIAANRGTDALQVAKGLVDQRTRILGADAFNTVTAMGMYGAAQAATGDLAGARASFAKSIPGLIAGIARASSNASGLTLTDRSSSFIIEAYLGVLAKSGQPGDAATAFRVADAVRGQAVQRAVAAAAARATVSDPTLADAIRRQQDTERQAEGLNEVLASDLALPPDQRDQGAVDELRTDVDQLQKSATDLSAEITRKFPEYAKLLNPPPAAVEDVQKALQPGEALFAAFVGQNHVYVWAVPKLGGVAFAVSPLSSSDIGKSVAALRKSLDPDAATAGDIPVFDVATAYKLYAGLLEPVKPGWQGAKNLLIVTNGALGQIPFELLATQNVKPPADQNGQPLFSGYKAVPWLIRDIAITELPSVTSLTTLRATPAAKGDRKPFIGFGDPWFSKKEEAQAIAQQGMQLALQVAGGGIVAMRKAPVHLRSAPKTEGINTAELGELPRLPDTADEVREVAEALKADPAKDVYLGAQANEQVVRTVDLNDRRVIMFATHGLIPGDLDGLTEPALALSAPDVAKVPGNGLLTVSKILGLRLNADWVVLSACNTAAGGGAGADAVSGLGLAFFYAGTRALLVSNWPVETTSARILTTDMFKREASTPGITRAEALRQAMLSLIDGPGFIDPASQKPVYSYAHPIFWAPFSLVGDGGAG